MGRGAFASGAAAGLLRGRDRAAGAICPPGWQGLLRRRQRAGGSGICGLEQGYVTGRHAPPNARDIGAGAGCLGGSRGGLNGVRLRRGNNGRSTASLCSRRQAASQECHLSTFCNTTGRKLLSWVTVSCCFPGQQPQPCAPPTVLAVGALQQAAPHSSATFRQHQLHLGHRQQTGVSRHTRTSCWGTGSLRLPSPGAAYKGGAGEGAAKGPGVGPGSSSRVGARQWVACHLCPVGKEVL